MLKFILELICFVLFNYGQKECTYMGTKTCWDEHVIICGGNSPRARIYASPHRRRLPLYSSLCMFVILVWYELRSILFKINIILSNTLQKKRTITLHNILDESNLSLKLKNIYGYFSNMKFFLKALFKKTNSDIYICLHTTKIYRVFLPYYWSLI